MNLRGGQFEGQGMYSLSKYLRERGDTNIRTVEDLISKARFFKDTRYHNPERSLESRLESNTLDGSVRMQFRFAVQQVVLACMAEHELDAFVAPTNNQPAPILGAPRALGKHARPDVWSFLGSQGNFDSHYCIQMLVLNIVCLGPWMVYLGTFHFHALGQVSQTLPCLRASRQSCTTASATTVSIRRPSKTRQARIATTLIAVLASGQRRATGW